jgi:hypothetical protein
MRYILFATTKTAQSFSLFKTALTALLITAARFPYGLVASDFGAPIGAIDLASVAAATDEDLLSAAGAKK